MSFSLPEIQFTTPRLSIRQYRLTDYKPLAEMVNEGSNDLKIHFPATYKACSTPFSTAQYILRCNSLRKSSVMCIAGIFHREDRGLIGHLVITKIDPSVPKCEAGYFIRSSWRNKGYATEALQGAMEWLTDKGGMEKVSLRIWTENTASGKVAENCGARLVGIAKKDFRTADNRFLDCEIWEFCK